jgi:hypothetical protein
MALGIVRQDPKEQTGPAVGVGQAPASPFEALRQRHRELQQAQHEDFDVPGYQALPLGDGQTGALVARYQRFELDKYHEALYGPAESTLARNAQFLIDALIGLYWRIDGDEDLRPLVPGQASGWADLAEQLGDEPFTDAYDMLLAIFGGDELALADHALDVGRWMEAGHQQVGRAFVGGL